jgi:hypothetical protein
LIERHLLTVIALKPFRCETCLHRFFRWPAKSIQQEYIQQETSANFTPAES